MIIRNDIKCPCCEADFTIEFDIEAHPVGPESCPFCENALPTDEDIAAVDDLMKD